MEINSKIFKAYDIRGIYPEELNDEAAYLIGRAFARKAGAKRITVGSDMRLSGPAIKKALIHGITDEGVDVKDIGLVPIDAIYFCVGKQRDEAGIMITASHNPKEYNGFKAVYKDIKPADSLELLEEVNNLPASPAGGPKETSEIKGEVFVEDIIAPYINHILTFVDVDKIKPFKVVIDAGNGMAGKIMPFLTESLPLNVIPLNFKVDGSFPAHPSNPLLPESQKEACETVIKEKADFGIIMDGDTDRLIFIDEKGVVIAADMTLLLLAKLFLEREPGAGIVYNIICSKAVPEFIKEWGGRPLLSKVGYTNIVPMMREQKGIMGGELSSHYSFRDNGYSDSGFIAFVILLQLLSNHNQPLSEIVKPFQKYAKSPELNFKVEDKTAVIERVKEKYSDGKQTFLDGISVDYKDWWFNVRPSNTEPLLRLTIEADTQEMLDEKIKELTKIITK
ncbi:MAG: phosphomannomutase/phosphoglucomutase [Candidatus Staskawiczbacteria bacterium]|nr:phosphomannomutase/phosphoglucomutase [Candidatus Staskawiczbacteria bacterium]